MDKTSNESVCQNDNAVSDILSIGIKTILEN